jgi:hypothetical protein
MSNSSTCHSSHQAPPAEITMDEIQEDDTHGRLFMLASPQRSPSCLASKPAKTSQILETCMPPCYRETTATKVRRRNRPNHIPRPRNPFMIYRTEFYRSKKSSLGFEKDHRHISRIIAYCWNTLSDAEKQPWHDKAAAEKAAHAQKYPKYQYMPLQRTEPIKKRKVKRSGEIDIKRCQAVASLIQQGKEGKELVSAISQLDHQALSKTKESVVPMTASFSVPYALPSHVEASIFRNPLIPTAESRSLHATSADDQHPSEFCSSSHVTIADYSVSPFWYLQHPSLADWYSSHSTLCRQTYISFLTLVRIPAAPQVFYYP